MTRQEADLKLKICLAGEYAVGKTSLIRRFVHDEFDDRYIATVGAKVTKAEVAVKHPATGEALQAVLTIWDVMGAEGLRQLLRDVYFAGVQGILAVCDVTRPETLSNLDAWRRVVVQTTGPVPAYVLGNKVDLAEEVRLEESEVASFAASHESPYLFTSAKTGANVGAAFRGLTELVLQRKMASLEALTP